MQHVKRSHPNDGPVENEPAAGCNMDEDSREASIEESNNGSAYDAVEEVSSLDVSGKAWLTMKLKDLEEKKRVEMTRFDSEIAAIKKILSC